MTSEQKPVSSGRVRIAGVIALVIGVAVILLTRGATGFEGALWAVIGFILSLAGLVAVIKGGPKKSE